MRKRTLFVSNFPSHWSAEELKALCESYGQVVKVEIRPSYGFVIFYHHTAAENALRGLNQQCIAGRVLRVNWAEYRVNEKAEGLPSCQLYITFSCAEDIELSEARLHSVFAGFGHLKYVIVMKSIVDHGRRNGYAFVHFEKSCEGLAACKQAVRQFKGGVFVDGVKYHGDYSKDLKKLLDVNKPSLSDTSSPAGEAEEKQLEAGSKRVGQRGSEITWSSQPSRLQPPVARPVERPTTDVNYQLLPSLPGVEVPHIWPVKLHHQSAHVSELS